MEHARRLGDRQRIASALSDLAMSIVFGTTPADVGARRCREMLDEVGDAVVLRAEIMINLAVLEAMRRDFDEGVFALQLFDRATQELGIRSMPPTRQWMRPNRTAGRRSRCRRRDFAQGSRNVGATGETMRLSTLAGFRPKPVRAGEVRRRGRSDHDL